MDRNRELLASFVCFLLGGKDDAWILECLEDLRADKTASLDDILPESMLIIKRKFGKVKRGFSTYLIISFGGESRLARCRHYPSTILAILEWLHQFVTLPRVFDDVYRSSLYSAEHDVVRYSSFPGSNDIAPACEILAVFQSGSRRRAMLCRVRTRLRFVSHFARLF